MKKLNRHFFCQPTLKVAKDILGKFLVHEYQGQKISGMIVETEAYIGEKDKASHAYRGWRTARNEAEYLVGGHVYIYLVYGMYWQFNISTSLVNKPECILIRALKPNFTPVFSLERREKDEDAALKNLTNGPGKLCRFMKLDKSFYSYDLCQKWAKLYIEDRGVKIKKKNIIASHRIGIDYAGPYWSKIPWRFWIKDNIFVSK